MDVFSLFCLEESDYVKFLMAVDVVVMLAMNCTISRLESLFVRGIKDQLHGILSCFDTYSKVRVPSG